MTPRRPPRADEASPFAPPKVAPVVLCADDFGLRPGVNDAIVRLLAAGVLTATTCITASPHFGPGARELRSRCLDADVGLHLTLTELAPLGPMPRLAPTGRLPSFRGLVARIALGAVDAAELDREFTRQLDAFESAFGRPPDFVDGHQHVHQLPTLRDAVVRLFQGRLAGSGAYLRTSHASLAALRARRVALVRAAGIHLAATSLRRSAQGLGIPTNEGLSGVYDFARAVPYETLFERFLVGLRPGSVVVCHPGELDGSGDPLDPIAERRVDELRFLESPRFGELVANRGVGFGRLGPARAQRTADDGHGAGGGLP